MTVVDVITISGQDHKGDVGRMTYYVPSGQSVGDITLQAQAMAVLLDGVTGMLLTGITLTLGLALPGGLKGTATTLQDVEKGANVGFDAANTAYRQTIRIPAINESLVSGEVFNIASGAGLAFVTGVINGVSPVLPSDKYGNDITGALEGIVTFRKA